MTRNKILLVAGIVSLVVVAMCAGTATTVVVLARKAALGFPTPAGPPKVVRTLGPADEPISGDAKWVGGKLQITASQPGVQRLFEVPLPRIEQSMITYRFRVQTEGAQATVYPEMWCRVEGFGEAFSRGLDQKVGGNNKLTTVQTPFFLEKGQFADLLKLNLVFEGAGTASVSDIEILATPLAPKSP